MTVPSRFTFKDRIRFLREQYKALGRSGLKRQLLDKCFSVFQLGPQFDIAIRPFLEPAEKVQRIPVINGANMFRKRFVRFTGPMDFDILDFWKIYPFEMPDDLFRHVLVW